MGFFDKAKMLVLGPKGLEIDTVTVTPTQQEVKPVEIDLNMYLSPHFQLKELVVTSHREVDNRPTPEVLERLKTLCTDFLEPIRKQFGPLIISSGYRCPDLNAKIGGAKDSAHMYGCAADFVPFNKQYTTRDVVMWVKNSTLEFDQVIDEYAGKTSNWIHIGMLRPNKNPKPRKEALLFKDGKYTVFV
jgi:hypothetical protein